MSVQACKLSTLFCEYPHFTMTTTCKIPQCSRKKNRTGQDSDLWPRMQLHRGLSTVCQVNYISLHIEMSCQCMIDHCPQWGLATSASWSFWASNLKILLVIVNGHRWPKVSSCCICLQIAWFRNTWGRKSGWYEVSLEVRYNKWSAAGDAVSVHK